MDDIENYVPKSFLDGQDVLQSFYTDGMLLVVDGKEITPKEKDAITSAVLKECAEDNKAEVLADKITDRR